MNKKLSELTSVKTGYSFRSKVPHHPRGGARIIQATDLTEDGEIDSEHAQKIEMDGKVSNASIANKDILLVSRGTVNAGFRAGLVKEIDMPTIASSSLHVIRVTDKEILPEFLAFYLNSSKAQRDLQKITSGSQIRMLLIKNLLELEIPIPPMETQTHLVELSQNIQKQKHLLRRRQVLLSDLTSLIFTEKNH